MRGEGDVDQGVEHEPSAGILDRLLLRQAFGTFATGVTVVTTGGTEPHAMTANSFTSVSLDPPLVLVSVDRRALMHHALPATGLFAVSVLAADQEEVARHFADPTRTRGVTEFDTVDWLPGRCSGVPLIQGALAQFECELWRTYDGGDHSIFVGRLLSADWRSDDEALLFLNGRFRRLAPVPIQVVT
ncbi:MAG: flavin reductase family protein [Frankiaceae bacterium]